MGSIPGRTKFSDVEYACTRWAQMSSTSGEEE